MSYAHILGSMYEHSSCMMIFLSCMINVDHGLYHDPYSHLFSKLMVALLLRTTSSQNHADLDVEQEKVDEGEDASEDQPGPVVVVEDVAGRESQLRWLPVDQLTHHLGQSKLKELGQVDEEGYKDRREDEGGDVAKVGVVKVDEVQPDGPLDGQEPLGGDAHHQVGLAAQQDCLCWMPEVREEFDVQLVVQVEVGVEAVDDNHDDEEEVDDGEGDDGLVEV